MLNLFIEALQVLAAEYKPDFLVITGDILDAPFYAMKERNPAFLKAARADYLSVQDALDRAHMPYAILAGNHDDFSIFQEVFSDRTIEFHIGNAVIQLFPWDREGEDHVPLREPGLYPRRPQGRGSLIHVQHYVITPNLDDFYPHTYKNRRRIMADNQALGVSLSISGHYHPGHPPVRTGGATYCIGAAFCEAPYPLYTYDLDSAEGSVSVTMRPLSRFASRPAMKVVSLREARGLAGHSSAAVSLIIIADEPLSEEECDRLWEELSGEGLTVEGIFPAPTEETRNELLRFYASIPEARISARVLGQ